MSGKKKAIRRAFRESVFTRDRYRCAVCGVPGIDRQSGDGNAVVLDAHHIIDRHEIPNGGYVKENGISLCPDCHLKAEDKALDFQPEDLYRKIGSSKDKAIKASMNALDD